MLVIFHVLQRSDTWGYLVNWMSLPLLLLRYWSTITLELLIDLDHPLRFFHVCVIALISLHGLSWYSTVMHVKGKRKIFTIISLKDMSMSNWNLHFIHINQFIVCKEIVIYIEHIPSFLISSWILTSHGVLFSMKKRMCIRLSTAIKTQLLEIGLVYY